MTVCAYCGGVHSRVTCPNCGAPAVNPFKELREFQRRLWSAVGIPAHFLEPDGEKQLRRARIAAANTNVEAMQIENGG